MGLVVSTNMSALNTINQLNKNSSLMNSSLQKLSSGYSINSAADNAAGLSISEKMRAQIQGLDQASSNSQDATSLTQTADGALDETTTILKRMRELAVQSSSDTLTDSDRTSIQDEVDSLRQEMDRIADDTEYNTKKLLNGDAAATTAVSGADSSLIESATGSNTVNAGSYTVTFTKVATEATTGSTITTNTSIGSKTTTLGTSYAGDIEINGTTITLDSGDTIEGAIEKINNETSTTGVTATYSGGYITLTDSTYGSSSEITLKGSTNQLRNLFNAEDSTSTSTSVTVNGTDATGSINGVAATGDGNSLTALGLTVTAENGATGLQGNAVTVTVNTSNVLTFQIGANSNQTMTLAIDDMDAASLGVAGDTNDTGIDLSSASKATSAITTIDSAISKVSAARSNLGAVQNSLDDNVDNLDTESENLTSAESNIRDTDMASEMSNYTKLSVITQAATAMLSKANQQPQQVLTLLQG